MQSVVHVCDKIQNRNLTIESSCDLNWMAIGCHHVNQIYLCHNCIFFLFFSLFLTRWNLSGPLATLMTLLDLASAGVMVLTRFHSGQEQLIVCQPWRNGLRIAVTGSWTHKNGPWMVIDGSSSWVTKAWAGMGIIWTNLDLSLINAITTMKCTEKSADDSWVGLLYTIFTGSSLLSVKGQRFLRWPKPEEKNTRESI